MGGGFDLGFYAVRLFFTVSLNGSIHLGSPFTAVVKKIQMVETFELEWIFVHSPILEVLPLFP